MEIWLQVNWEMFHLFLNTLSYTNDKQKDLYDQTKLVTKLIFNWCLFE